MNPGPSGSVTVTFNETAATPVFGSPSLPATLTSSTCPAVTLLAGTPPVPSRVSNNRFGITGTKPELAPNQPDTSASRCVAANVYRQIVPVGDTGAITAFGTVWPV